MFFRPAIAIVWSQQRPRGYGSRVRILAAHDPLRNVPRGDFSLRDYSYEGADLCHAQFGNCALPSLNVKA